MPNVFNMPPSDATFFSFLILLICNLFKNNFFSGMSFHQDNVIIIRKKVNNTMIDTVRYPICQFAPRLNVYLIIYGPAAAPSPHIA